MIKDLAERHRKAVQYIDLLMTKTKMGGMHSALLKRMRELSMDTVNEIDPEAKKNNEDKKELFTKDAERLFG